MALVKMLRLYEQHADEWDAEFERISERFADRMQCRKGCSMCCSHIFSISPLEAAQIAQAVAELPSSHRERLRARARAYMEDVRSLGLHSGRDDESVTPVRGVHLPCPALENDACSIYAARPLICRKWGIPVFDPSKPQQLHACELNFRQGEAIEPGDLVDAQSTLLERWVALKQQAREDLALPSRAMTVAEAILTDIDTLERWPA
jgi:Fe-S-cluster containining protein